MKKIAIYEDEIGWIFVFAGLNLFSTLVQFLIFRSCDIITSDASIGTWLNLVLAAILFIPLCCKSAQNESGTLPSLSVSLLAVIGIYWCVIGYCNWWLLGGCMLFLAYNLMLFEREKINIGMVCIIIGLYLSYCVGTYFAMLLAARTPAINTLQMTILLLLEISVWLRALLDGRCLFSRQFEHFKAKFQKNS